LPFLIFIFIINLLFGSLMSSIISSLKLVLFVLYSSVIIYTTKSNDMTYGLEKLFSPLKIFGVNVGIVALTISLALRFIPTIFDEGYKVYKSQISRGLNFNGSLKEKIDKIMSLIIPIFNLSLKRSEDVSYTLDTRLYRVNERRTKYKLRNLSVLDENILLIHVFVLLLFIVVEVIL